MDLSFKQMEKSLIILLLDQVKHLIGYINRNKKKGLCFKDRAL